MAAYKKYIAVGMNTGEIIIYEFIEIESSPDSQLLNRRLRAVVHRGETAIIKSYRTGIKSMKIINGKLIVLHEGGTLNYYPSLFKNGELNL